MLFKHWLSLIVFGCAVYTIATGQTSKKVWLTKPNYVKEILFVYSDICSDIWKKFFPKELESFLSNRTWSMNFLSNSTWSMNLLCLTRQNKIVAKRKNPNVHNLTLLDTELCNCILGVAVLLATYLLNRIVENSCWTIYRK